MSGRPYSRTRGIALAGTFAALISVSAQVSIPLPITPVPITLQVFVVYLIIMILGPYYGSLALLIYLLLGAIGVPVYANLRFGLPELLGPRGGYLFAFPVAALLGGLVSANRALSRKVDAVRLAVSSAIAIAVIYAIGVTGLAIFLNGDFSKAILFGLIPFIPLDIAKAVIAVPIALRLRWSHLQLPIGTSKAQSLPARAR